MDTLASLSNEQLLAQLPLLCSKERRATAEVIVYLAEVERRKLYLREACASLYSFCVERLGYSEQAALKRMRVARLYLAFPQVLEELKSGAIHLTGLFLLSGHLTGENAQSLLAEARGKTRRELELELARWFPRPDVLPTVTPIGVDSARPGVGGNVTYPGIGKADAAGAVLGFAYPGTGNSERQATARSEARGRVQPLSARSYRVEFTASAELHAKLEHAQNLLSHAVPPGALAELFERALDELIDLETKRRQGVLSEKPRKRRPLKEGSRHVPVAVAREVWDRDEYQCTFVDKQGRRCSEKRYVTVEHLDPHARGGPPSVENLCLLCAPHNQDSAQRAFGAAHIERKQREGQAHAKAQSALVSSGFQHKQVRAALDTLRKRGTEPEVEVLLRQALALLCPSRRASPPDRPTGDSKRGASAP